MILRNNLTTFSGCYKGTLRKLEGLQVIFKSATQCKRLIVWGKCLDAETFFILLAHGNVITNIAQDTQADFR